MARRKRDRRTGSAHVYCVVSALLLLTSTAVSAQGAADIVKSGKGAEAPACMQCHGERGEGNMDAGYPRLSGLAAGYLVHELNSFDDGSRANEIMQPIAKALSKEDRRALAEYYAGLPVIHAEGGEPPDEKAIARGKVIATIGNWSKGVPGCAQCHGPAGQGVGASFPPLAGQPAAYLSAQLMAWKGKTRRNDPLNLMAGLSGKLSDDDVAAVAAYYASLPASPSKTGGK